MRHPARLKRLAIPAVLPGLLLLSLACPTRQNRGRGNALTLNLELVDSARLPGPAVGLCTDRNGLLLADRSGTDIYCYDLNLAARSPVAIGPGITGVRGIAADAFFIFLYDSGRIYRMDRSGGELVQVMSGVDCRYATVLAGGELGFCDATNNRILYVDPTQKVSMLSTDHPDLQPTAFAVGPDGNSYVLNAALRDVVVLSRIGEALRSIPLPGAGIRIAVDDSLRVYVLERTGTRLWRFDSDARRLQADAAQLGLDFVASEMVVVKDWLFLLDRDSRILKLRIPRVTG